MMMLTEQREIPKLVCVDFETELNGLGSIEYWLPGFRILSASFSWFEDGQIKTVWRYGQQDVWLMLQRLSDLNIPLLAHNIAFEMGCSKVLFPTLNLNWSIDSMRLVALFDGGRLPDRSKTIDDELAELEGEEIEKKSGIGLKASIKRIAPEHADKYYEPFNWIAENVPEARADTLGLYLTRLPLDLLEKYNTADTICCLHLYKIIIEYFNTLNYDWQPDHQLYLNAVKLIVTSQIKGIKINNESLRLYKENISQEINNIEENFKKENASYIENVENALLDKRKSKYKTERGKSNAIRPDFNIGSNDHLARLFVDEMGCEVIFKTPTGKPSCRAAHLQQFGPAGIALQNRRKRLLVLQQTEKLLYKGSNDGRWHISLRPCGTITGRFAGGDGLNIQALARRDKGFMSSLVADPGYTFISIDFSAGEPSITTEISGDKNYRLATYDLIGKEPYWNGDILMLDDLYLMCSSVSPMGRTAIKEAWNKDWDGLSFKEQWLKDPEVIKKALKSTRSFHKTLALAIGYGCGVKKLVTYSHDKGYQLSFRDGAEFWENYWQLFPDVKALFDKMARIVQKNGWFVNPFGYRLVPPEPRKSGNYLIQSSVSGLMNFLCLLLFNAAPFAKFISCIHDEVLISVPLNREKEFKIIKEQVMEDLNGQLKWSVNIRAGYQAGNNLYEAK